MTANRLAPTPTTDPGGINGTPYANQVAEEIEALWNGVITQAASVGGTANAITIICTPPLVADPVDGQTFRFTPTANNSTAVDVEPDGRGPWDLMDQDGAALGADDLVDGRPVMFHYVEADDHFRLEAPTTQALLDSLAAAIAASTHMELIGDTTISVAVANVEHTFVANTYLEIISYAVGIDRSTTATTDFSIRNVSGAIATASTTSAANPNRHAIRGNAFIDSVSSTKIHGVSITGGINSSGAQFVDGSTTGAAATSATAPDRVRWASSAGNLTAGRVVTFGIKAPV